MTQELSPQERATQDYFETRIQPAIDNGPDLSANYMSSSQRDTCEAEGIVPPPKPVDVIFFRDDGKSIGVPIQLKGIIEEMTPDVWEALAYKDKRGAYKGWIWTFFPKMVQKLAEAVKQ